MTHRDLLYRQEIRPLDFVTVIKSVSTTVPEVLNLVRVRVVMLTILVKGKQVNQTRSLSLDCFERMISRNTPFLVFMLASRSVAVVPYALLLTMSAHETDVVFPVPAMVVVLLL